MAEKKKNIKTIKTVEAVNPADLEKLSYKNKIGKYEPISLSLFTSYLKKACSELNLPVYTPKNLRYTWCNKRLEDSSLNYISTISNSLKNVE